MRLQFVFISKDSVLALLTCSFVIKHYVNNQALRMLHHRLINSRAQYGIIPWRRAASCHLQPILVALNHDMHKWTCDT